MNEDGFPLKFKVLKLTRLQTIIAQNNRAHIVSRRWLIELGVIFASRKHSFASGLTALKIPLLGLAASVAILFASLAVVNGFDLAMRERVLSRVPHVLLTPAFDSAFEGHWRTRFEADPLVMSATPLIEVPVLLISEQQIVPVNIQGFDIQTGSKAPAIANDLTEGRFSQLGEQKYRIAMSEQLANELQVAVGDQVSAVLPELRPGLIQAPRQRSLKIAALFNSQSDLDEKLTLTSIETARRLGGVQVREGISIELNDLFSGQALIERIQSDPEMPIMRISLWQHRYGSLYAAIALQKQILFVLLFLVVSIAAFNLGSHFVVSIESRRRDIAILRTLGAERREILALFLTQGMVQCSVATALGLVLGLLILPGFVFLLDLVATFSEIDLFAEYFVHYLPYDYSAMDASWVALSSLVVGLVAHIYPAIRASQTSPSHELNHVRIR